MIADPFASGAFTKNPQVDAYLATHPGWQHCKVGIESGALVSLHTLWRNYNEPDLTPERYYRQYGRRSGCRYELGDDGDFLAEPGGALFYLMMLDPELSTTMKDAIRTAYQVQGTAQDDASLNVPVYEWFTALFRVAQGEAIDNATNEVVAGVVWRSENLDDRERETLVSRARRAFDEFREDRP